METLKIISVIIGEIAVIIGFLSPVFIKLKKVKTNLDYVKEGNKCLLRSEMTRTYYRHLDDKTLREYEYENFMKNYAAYKALDGNSFVDKIHKEIQEWKIVS